MRFTPKQYAEYLAKRVLASEGWESQPNPQNAEPQITSSRRKKRAGVEQEKTLHRSIIEYCDAKGWPYLHGSMAHRTRRTAGEPDFVILARNGITFFVECKTAIGRLTPEQERFAARAQAAGHTVHVVRTMDDFLKIVHGSGPSRG